MKSFAQGILDRSLVFHKVDISFLFSRRKPATQERTILGLHDRQERLGRKGNSEIRPTADDTHLAARCEPEMRALLQTQTTLFHAAQKKNMVANFIFFFELLAKHVARCFETAC